MDKSSDGSPMPQTSDEIIEEVVAEPKPKHSSWYRSWRMLNKDQRGALITAIFLAVFLPITALAVRNEQLTRGRAADPVTPPGEPKDFGQAISLNGSTDYVSSNTQGRFKLSNGYTVEAWAKLNSNEFTNYSILDVYAKNNVNPLGLKVQFTYDYSDERYELRYILTNSDSQVVNGKEICFSELPVVYTVVVTDPQDPVITNWHHVAGVVQEDGTINIFLDGKMSTDEKSVVKLCEDRSEIMIGAANAGQAVEFFDGEIDDVRISSVARYQSDFLPPAPHNADNATFALYKLDGDYLDSSGKGRNLQPYGNPLFVPSTIVLPPQPSPSLMPSPTPTSTPIPSPSPFINSKPTITTTSLPPGQVGAQYQGFVEASDPDTNQWLSMTASGLPTGLNLGPCSFQPDQTPSTTTCYFYGTPTTAGSFRSNFTVTDPLGAKGTKRLNILIQ